MVNLESLNIYFYNAEPIPYNLKKGGEILIYPILLKDALTYDWAKQILEIQKNEYDNIEIIKKSYLDFIIENIIYGETKLKEKDRQFIYQFKVIIKLCLGFDRFAFDKEKNKNCILICDENDNVTQIINHKEFEDIKNIILNQNNPNYDNRYINPEVRELMEEYYKVKYANVSSPTFEQKKAFVCSKLGKTFYEINNMTYREFELIYQSCLDSEIYLTTKITEASYKYEVKNPTNHPLFEIKKDAYAELFEDTSVLSNKGISGADNLNNLNLN